MSPKYLQEVKTAMGVFGAENKWGQEVENQKKKKKGKK